VTEQSQPTPADGEKKAPAGGEKKAPASRKLLIYVSGALFTALLGWSISYYLPGLLSDSSKPPPIATDVIDNPSLIDTFSEAPQTILLPGVRNLRAANPPFPFCDQFRSWAIGLGGIDAGQTRFRLIVQGDSDLPVVLNGMSARIIRRISTRAASVPVECGTAGEVTVRSIQINLDASPPLADYRSAYGTKPFAFTLNKGETEIFDITAQSSLPNVVTEWDLVLNVTIDGNRQTYVIEDRGKPFETAGWTARATKGTYEWTTAWSPSSGPP